MTGKQPPPSRQGTERPITLDPLYYVILAFFALLTTALGMWLKSPWFMAFAQTAALWLFALATFRQRSVTRALLVLGLWCALQFFVVGGLTLIAPSRAEAAIGNGFLYREALLEWHFTGESLPASWLLQPLARGAELLGVTVGAAISAGLLGIWFLVRLVNLYAFGLAAMAQVTGEPSLVFTGLAPWLALRILGSIATIASLGQVGFTGVWNPLHWPALQRRTLWIGIALLVAGLLVELIVV